ncbi:hypothetical protein ACRZ5S_18190 [Vibrio scophthalmi]|uniref:hypothetical protein n=1 Tax=Vibrio scophthalmi TaxID=45658 RepID=UPI003EC062BC
MDEEALEVRELKDFKSDCMSLKEDIVVQKHLVDGTSYFFQLYYDEAEEFVFKKSLAESLDVHIRDIAIVGSGKLGFSIKPSQSDSRLYQFKVFDQDFDEDPSNKKSDLDVAIVSGQLFDEQLVSLYNHTDAYMDTVFSGGAKNQFAKYVLKGWIRPDKLPDDYTISPTINNVQEELSNKYKRDVNIGIYKSWYYFEQYHRNNIQTLSLNLIA